MLVLNRKSSERIKITAPNGDVITVMLCRINGSKEASIGVEAPISYSILREGAIVQEPKDIEVGSVFLEPRKPGWYRDAKGWGGMLTKEDIDQLRKAGGFTRGPYTFLGAEQAE